MLRTTWIIIASVFLLVAAGATASFAVPVPALPGPAAVQPGLPAGIESPVPAGAVPSTEPTYRLRADDVLQLSVMGEPSMQGVYLTVTPEGVLNAPVVGAIQAAGHTVDEVSQAIADRFVKMQYLRDPVIQLTLYQPHKMKVRVLGQVQRPGLQDMRDGDTADQAVAEAGGFLPDSADLAHATITRIGDPEPISINLRAFYYSADMSQNVKLHDGDTIYIPEDTSNRFYVLGYVARPQMFPLKPGMTVTEALTQAGGAIPRASIARTVIIRKAHDGKPVQRIPVNVSEIIKTGDTTRDVALQAGDVVYVPETSAPDLGKLGSVIGAVVNIAYLNRLGVF